MTPDAALPAEPTRDQLLAMAYADDQLAEPARLDFERRLAQEPALRHAVSQLKELELLARAAAPKEPMDHEWDALARDPLQRGALGLGWLLLGLGLLGGCAFGLWKLFDSDMPRGPKLGCFALILGVALLFGATLRARLRTWPLDPYRKIKR